MTTPHSLRSRLLIGLIVWPLGRLALAHMSTVELMNVFPQIRRIPHAPVVALGLVLMANSKSCSNRPEMTRRSMFRPETVSMHGCTPALSTRWWSMELRRPEVGTLPVAVVQSHAAAIGV